MLCAKRQKYAQIVNLAKLFEWFLGEERLEKLKQARVIKGQI